MITRRMGDKLEDLKTYFNTKLSEQEEIRTKTFNNIITDLKKEIIKEIQHEVLKQYKQNKTTFRKQHTNKKQVAELRELNINNQSGYEELEQNGKRLC